MSQDLFASSVETGKRISENETAVFSTSQFFLTQRDIEGGNFAGNLEQIQKRTKTDCLPKQDEMRCHL